MLTLDSKTGDEIARVDFQSDTEIQPTLIHGALDEDHFIVGVNFYDERGYLQDAYWVNARTGESGLLVDSAPIARVVGGDQLLFTKGQTLYRAGYDPATRSVTGAAEPVFTGLRTANSWSSGNFDVAANGTVVHLPGGLQGGSRSLWTSEGPEDEPRPLEQSSRPFESGPGQCRRKRAAGDPHQHANDMWDLWAAPPTRRASAACSRSRTGTSMPHPRATAGCRRPDHHHPAQSSQRTRGLDLIPGREPGARRPGGGRWLTPTTSPPATTGWSTATGTR